jgi:2-desacetyl-2-hydroxyethyl bacteriochlorophyllide A dehydrogenase
LREVIFRGVADVVLEERKLGPLPAEHVRVRHLYSLVSAGTEILKLQGNLGALHNSGVGYSGVGEIIAGEEATGFSRGDLVFTRERHADIVDVPKEKAVQTFIPVTRELAKEATFLELGKVAMHGLHRVQIVIGDWVVVFGLGIVGQLSAQLALAAAGKRVLAIEPSPFRRKMAEQAGIPTIDPGSGDYVAQIKEITNGGADIIIESSGHPRALADSLKIAGFRGQIAVVAGHYGLRELDLKTDFQDKELSLIGARRIENTQRSLVDRWPVYECKKEFYRMIVDHAVQVEPLITHCLLPFKAPEVYQRLLDKDDTMLGVIFDWTKEE